MSPSQRSRMVSRRIMLSVSVAANTRLTVECSAVRDFRLNALGRPYCPSTLWFQENMRNRARRLCGTCRHSAATTLERGLPEIPDPLVLPPSLHNCANVVEMEPKLGNPRTKGRQHGGPEREWNPPVLRNSQSRMSSSNQLD